MQRSLPHAVILLYKIAILFMRGNRKQFCMALNSYTYI